MQLCHQADPTCYIMGVTAHNEDQTKWFSDIKLHPPSEKPEDWTKTFIQDYNFGLIHKGKEPSHIKMAFKSPTFIEDVWTMIASNQANIWRFLSFEKSAIQEREIVASGFLAHSNTKTWNCKDYQAAIQAMIPKEQQHIPWFIDTATVQISAKPEALNDKWKTTALHIFCGRSSLSILLPTFQAIFDESKFHSDYQCAGRPFIFRTHY